MYYALWNLPKKETRVTRAAEPPDTSRPAVTIMPPHIGTFSPPRVQIHLPSILALRQRVQYKIISAAIKALTIAGPIKNGARDVSRARLVAGRSVLPSSPIVS